MVNEAHIFNAENGHCLSTDCWCEPTDMGWKVTSKGIKVYVVFHEDLIDPRIHHTLVLEARDESDEDWISRALDHLFEKESQDGEND